ncbi:hypothetical protein TNCV_4374271 [Trichonephila clavipes]|uniref:Uncharacterized protein n=1 Tax=Trichonephila clavipes TaxID=2585209 RepID=A0A8X6UXR0_TRICX|nr:hypothetical protein TNCV_4374271 [Trichonephila clavipes]
MPVAHCKIGTNPTLAWYLMRRTVAKQSSEFYQHTAVLQVASTEDQRSQAVKRKGTPDHNSWLRACVACNGESRIGMLPWASPDTSSMIVRTQLKVEFVAKHYTSPSA